MEIEVTPDGPSSYVGACSPPCCEQPTSSGLAAGTSVAERRSPAKCPPSLLPVRGSLPAVSETYSLSLPAESAQELIGGDAGLPDLPLERRREVVEGIADRVRVVRRAGKNDLTASVSDEGLLL